MKKDRGIGITLIILFGILIATLYFGNDLIGRGIQVTVQNITNIIN